MKENGYNKFVKCWEHSFNFKAVARYAHVLLDKQCESRRRCRWGLIIGSGLRTKTDGMLYSQLSDSVATLSYPSYVLQRQTNEDHFRYEETYEDTDTQCGKRTFPLYIKPTSIQL